MAIKRNVTLRTCVLTAWTAFPFSARWGPNARSGFEIRLFVGEYSSSSKPPLDLSHEENPQEPIVVHIPINKRANRLITQDTVVAVCWVWLEFGKR